MRVPAVSATCIVYACEDFQLMALRSKAAKAQPAETLADLVPAQPRRAKRRRVSEPGFQDVVIALSLVCSGHPDKDKQHTCGPYQTLRLQLQEGHWQYATTNNKK